MEFSMGITVESRITSIEAKEAIYNAHNGGNLSATDKATLDALAGKDLVEQAELDAVVLGSGNITPEQAVIIDGLSVLQSSASEIDGIFSNGKNLFDISTEIANKYIYFGTGAISDNANYSIYGFMNIDASQSYSFGYVRTLAWYDENENFISGLDVPSSPQTAPSNAKYARICVAPSSATPLQFEQGTINTAYENYLGKYIKPTYLTKNTDMASFETTKNLLDENDFFNGYYINTTNGEFALSSSLSASNFIKIEPLTSYILSGAGTVGWGAWYDENYEFIAGADNLRVATVSPSTAKYVRVTSYTDSLSTVQLEANIVATFYENFTRLKTEYIEIPNELKNKKWATLGDSITHQLLWQPKVSNTLHLLHSNHGIGGTKISGTTNQSMVHDDRINAIDINTDIISVLGGTNDWGLSIPLGEENSQDITTFYGALNVLIGKLCVRFPTKRIVFMTTPYAEIDSYVIGGAEDRGWVNSSTNQLGLTTLDYANAIINVCIKSSIPFVDFRELGFNSYTINSFTNDGVHPNLELGKTRLADSVIKKFREIGL